MNIICILFALIGGLIGFNLGNYLQENFYIINVFLLHEDGLLGEILMGVFFISGYLIANGILTHEK